MAGAGLLQQLSSGAWAGRARRADMADANSATDWQKVRPDFRASGQPEQLAAGREAALNVATCDWATRDVMV